MNYYLIIYRLLLDKFYVKKEKCVVEKVGNFSLCKLYKIIYWILPCNAPLPDSVFSFPFKV